MIAEENHLEVLRMIKKDERCSSDNDDPQVAHIFSKGSSWRENGGEVKLGEHEKRKLYELEREGRVPSVILTGKDLF
jgi:hypothetical protein